MMAPTSLLLTCLLLIQNSSIEGFLLPKDFTFPEVLDKPKMHAKASVNPDKLDPEATLDFCGISNYHGYDCEEFYHQVETKDGFLLTLHRITGRMGKKSSNTSRPPVFVQHGLLGDSSMWILNLPNQTVPFLLSDAGYDVWLGNSRGNTYSTAHTTLSPDTDQFWAWSWDEMAEYDLPASIDFVLEMTGYDQLHYIGHSQGTLIAFAHLSTSHTNKISHMIALGPVFHVSHMTSPLQYISFTAQNKYLTQILLGSRSFLPSDGLMKWVADVACPDSEKYFPMCGDILILIAGPDKIHLNETRMPVYINHTPAGTSVQNIVHFGQMVNTKTCSRFDYGSAQANEKHYGNAVPPAYDISSINTTVSLIWAENDTIADPQDVQYIIDNLKTVKNKLSIPGWNHLDFLWALNAKPVMIDKIIETINSDFPSRL